MSALQQASTHPLRTDSEAPRSAWFRTARLWAVVACFVGVGIARSVQVGIPFRDPHGAFLVSRVLLTLCIFLGLVILDGLIRADHPRTVGRVWATVRLRWTPGRLALAWVVVAFPAAVVMAKADP